MADKKRGLRPGQQVMAYLNVEGRNFRGVVLNILRQGVWVQISDFPAPILFPHQCIRVA